MQFCVENQRIAIPVFTKFIKLTYKKKYYTLFSIRLLQ
jgi:hypothetical protein